MDILGFLGLLGDSIGGALQDVVDWATAGFGTLFYDDTQIEQQNSGFISWVWGALTAIIGFLDKLWKWLRDHILKAIINFILKQFAALRRFFKPLIDAINKQRQQMMLIWNIYIKPILDFIQALRRFLLVFRLLGFKWAKQLDNYLVALEVKISQAFLGTLQNLNILANWINFILDPFGLFQPIPLLGAIARSVGALIGIIFGGMNQPVPPLTYPSGAPVAGSISRPILLQQVQERSLLQSPTPDDISNINAVTVVWQQLGFNAPLY